MSRKKACFHKKKQALKSNINEVWGRVPQTSNNIGIKVNHLLL